MSVETATGVLAVPCPVCRARAGRRCRNRRGYLVGTHPRRVLAWRRYLDDDRGPDRAVEAPGPAPGALVSRRAAVDEPSLW